MSKKSKDISLELLLLEITKLQHELHKQSRSFDERLEKIYLTQLINSPNAVMDVNDVSRILKITPKSVYRWVYEKKISSFKKGGRRFFYAGEIFNETKGYCRRETNKKRRCNGRKPESDEIIKESQNSGERPQNQ